MPKHRIGTIQSSRPGYAAVMPCSTQYGKAPADFQRIGLKLSAINHFTVR
ncbi:hypothetical protein [Mesorhizobium sp. A556]